MIKKISVLLLFHFLLTGFVYAYSDNILNEMEYIKYGSVFEQEDLSSRLQRLETDCFGMSQGGSLDSRIENLSKIITAGKYKNVQAYNAYNYPKKNILQKVWNGFSNYMSAPYITGFSPPVIYDNGYGNNLYRREYMDMRNNAYCPFNDNNNGIEHQKFHNHYYNKYNKNNLNSYNPYRHNPVYSPYMPTDLYSNASMGSTVRILDD